MKCELTLTFERDFDGAPELGEAMEGIEELAKGAESMGWGFTGHNMLSGTEITEMRSFEVPHTHTN